LEQGCSRLTDALRHVKLLPFYVIRGVLARGQVLGGPPDLVR